MLKIAISGSTGRIGKALIKAIGHEMRILSWLEELPGKKIKI